MKIYHILFLVLILSNSAYTQSRFLKQDKVLVAVYGDYLNTNQQWSIAGNSSGQNPNILSEVKWKDLKLKGAGLDLQVNVWSHYFFTGKFHRASIHSGSATDTDYRLDNRTSPSYNATLNTDDGYSYSCFGGLGYKFMLLPALSISPYGGYLKSRQMLFLKNFSNNISNAEAMLNSTYKTNWTGPQIGSGTDWKLKDWLHFKTDLSYTQLKYMALADWNMIDAFKHPISFKHQAEGYQGSIALQVQLDIIAQLSIYVNGNYTHAETGFGTDQLFLVDGRILESRFNGAFFSSKSIGLGLCYHP